MKPSAPNAFARPSGTSPRLASMLRSLDAEVLVAPFGLHLRLSPMRTVDALSALAGTALASPTAELLLTCVDDAVWGRSPAPLDVRSLCLRLGLDYQADVGDEAVILRSDQIAAVLGTVNPADVRVAIVDGPIEGRDATAIRAAVAAHRSPLDVEVRAVAWLQVREDRVVELHARDRTPIDEVIAANIGHYLSAILNEPFSSLASPAPWQVERLLSETGRLTLRPIETETHATFVDVGVATHGVEGRPANRTLIYDRPSRTWHDEPA
jgi:hypothetical protein